MGAREGSSRLSVPPQGELEPCGGIGDLIIRIPAYGGILYRGVVDLGSPGGLNNPQGSAPFDLVEIGPLDTGTGDVAVL